MIELYPILIIITTLLLSAIFSGMEIAFISSDKLQVEVESKQGGFSSRIVSGFMNKPSQFISTTLVGNNLTLVIYGIFMAQIIGAFFEGKMPDWLSMVLEVIISTFVVLATAEFTPKSIFLINPNRSLSIFAIPMKIFSWILYPLVVVIVWLSKLFITKVLQLEYEEDKPIYSFTDLNNFVKKNLKEKEEFDENAKIFNNALEFKTIKVRECLVPRTEVVAVDVEETIEDLKKALIESGHSKIIVYRENIDDVIGYCHSSQLFNKPASIKDIMKSIIIVPETELANDLMVQMINEHKSLALVVDEFGGTSGIVTLEDIMEEIFGEIRDEHDVENLVEQEIEPGVYLVNARLEVDYLNEKYGWSFEDGDYETLGGFLLSVTEDFPEQGEVIVTEKFEFTIVSMFENRINNIKVKELDIEER